MNSLATTFISDNCEPLGVQKITDYIMDSISAFTYGNRPLQELEIYVIFKNNGGYKVFKRIREHIVIDKLDKSYTQSRELVCIDNWNVKNIYKIYFDSGMMNIKKISFRQLHRVLFNTVKPTLIKYVLGVEEGEYSETILVDYDAYSSLTYSELRNMVYSAYNLKLSKRGLPINTESDLACHIIDYEDGKGD